MKPAGMGFNARTVSGFMLGFLMLIATPVFATETNINDDGFAVRGYDPVAYFTKGMPVAGINKWQTEVDGIRYRFSSKENLDAFSADPAKYSPAFGGYCSYGVRVGRKFNIDPNAWEIVDNRLYLLLNAGTYTIWKKDKSQNITIANQIWPNIKQTPDEVLAKKQ